MTEPLPGRLRSVILFRVGLSPAFLIALSLAWVTVSATDCSGNPRGPEEIKRGWETLAAFGLAPLGGIVALGIASVRARRPRTLRALASFGGLLSWGWVAVAFGVAAPSEFEAGKTLLPPILAAALLLLAPLLSLVETIVMLATRRRPLGRPGPLAILRPVAVVAVGLGAFGLAESLAEIAGSAGVAIWFLPGVIVVLVDGASGLVLRSDGGQRLLIGFFGLVLAVYVLLLALAGGAGDLFETVHSHHAGYWLALVLALALVVGSLAECWLVVRGYGLLARAGVDDPGDA